jgi:hypothetical protein
MNKSLRSLVVIAGVAVLASSSQAIITFSNYNSQFDFNPVISNQLKATPTHLHQPVIGSGTVTDSGSFDVKDSLGLSALDVTEVDGFAIDGKLTLTATIWEGSTPVSLYNSSATSPAVLPLYTMLSPSIKDNSLPSLTGTYLVTYTATFQGYGPGSVGYLGSFAFDAYPTPEPSAYAALGVGVVGLLIRRRRSGK